MSDLARVIHNERVKYAAAALDRLSTGFFLIGGITPLIQIVLPLSSGELVSLGRIQAALVLIAAFVGSGYCFHRLGKRLLGTLK
jgi:hypothetical protein